MAKFITLERKAPLGSFGERMLSQLSTALEAKNPDLEVINAQTGDNPFGEDIEVEFRVPAKAPRKNLSGPKLFFTFSSEVSPEENLEDLRKFAAEHSETASTSPELTLVGVARGH